MMTYQYSAQFPFLDDLCSHYEDKIKRSKRLSFCDLDETDQDRMVVEFLPTFNFSDILSECDHDSLLSTLMLFLDGKITSSEFSEKHRALITAQIKYDLNDILEAYSSGYYETDKYDEDYEIWRDNTCRIAEWTL